MRKQLGNVKDICRDPRSTKFVMNKLNSVFRDTDRVLFHDSVADLLREYAYDPRVVDDTIGYLNSLSDDDGVFCRSIGRRESMLDTIYAFTGNQASDFRWNQNYQAAFSKVSARYPKHLEPQRYNSNEDIEVVISDWDTSAGWSGVIAGKPKKVDNRENVYLTWGETVQRALNVGSFNAPVIPGSRIQASGEFNDDGSRTYSFKRKKRPIWMTDLYQLITEQMFSYPLTQWVKHYRYSAIGKDDRTISNFVFTHRDRYPSYLSIDYSKYDSSIPSWLIRDAFKIVRECFPDLNSEEESLFAICVEDFINKNVLLPDGSMLFIDHGNPSGSGFTALINGICNEIISETWAIKFQVDIQYMIMGDDNLMFHRGEVDVAAVSSYILHNFGVTVNADKSASGSTRSYPEFLSRIWTSRGAYRHPHQLISKLVFPERFRNTPSDRDVQLVVMSYMLAYPAGMRDLINFDKFMMDTGLSLTKSWVEIGTKEMPWNLRTVLESGPGNVKVQS